MAENALTQSINTITRIGELAVQAANDSYGPGEREAIAMEAEQLIKHMVELANTQDAQGQSIFSGYKTDKKAFELTKMAKLIGDGMGQNLSSGIGKYAGANGFRWRKRIWPCSN